VALALVAGMITFALKHWRLLALAALLAAGWWWHAGQVSTARDAAIAIGRAEVQAEWNAERAALAAAAAAAAEINAERKDSQDEAVHTATTDRATAARRLPADLAAARTERDRLRHALDIALNTVRSCDVSGATAPAADAHAKAVRAVFDDMAREAEGLATAADGHAADALMYQRAWPR